MRRALVVLALLSAACNQREQIAIHYTLDNIAPGDVVRVATVVSVDPADARLFFADQPYRSVAQGVGYEVRDVDGSGKRELLITHDATLGYQFTPTFTFTLLPPDAETPPPLQLSANAAGATDTIGASELVAAHFSAGGSAAVKISDLRCGGVACAPDELCCDAKCVRVAIAEKHCGACDVACGTGELCLGGTCHCQGGGACTDGRSCCTNGCFDLTSDAFNCGACGHACNAGESCTAGTCHCGAGPACTGASPLCCPNQQCSTTGSCDCNGSMCGAPNVCCSGTMCINEATDNGNCGMCGKSCAAPLACAGGSCACNGNVCNPGDTCCSFGCANTRTDVANCGGCGHACQPGETCPNSQCVCGGTSCSAGQNCCPSSAAGPPVCSDPKTDPKNCGTCGHACRTGEQCAGGACVCPGAQRACVNNETCCADGCFDTSSDPGHCASCTTPCANGQACVQGMCMGNTGCGPCTNGNTCQGHICACIPTLPPCTGPLTCCPPGGCVDLLNDVNNCGVCGKVCSAGSLCCNGFCTPLGPGNCGACGLTCPNGGCCVCGSSATCPAGGAAGIPGGGWPNAGGGGGLGCPACAGDPGT